MPAVGGRLALLLRARQAGRKETAKGEGSRTGMLKPEPLRPAARRTAGRISCRFGPRSREKCCEEAWSGDRHGVRGTWRVE
eukprot:1172096-Rhodomonas_salina.3